VTTSHVSTSRSDATGDATRNDRRTDRPHGPVLWAAEPLPAPMEGAALVSARRAHSPWRAPALVAVTAYVAIGLVLLVAGWLIVHTSLGDPVRSWDETLSRDISVGRTSGWSDYSDVGTSGANTMPVVLGMVVVTIALAALRRWRDMLLVPLALAIELSTFLTVNYLVGRDRPSVAQLGGEPGTHSFPSGHVAATFVLWFGIAVLLGAGRWRTPWRLLAWVLAAVPVLTVAFSRVYRGMHFTTDVLAGLLLGAAALAAAAVATRSSWLGSQPAVGREGERDHDVDLTGAEVGR
jgi:membrane-associated phospholipid phosphatase